MKEITKNAQTVRMFGKDERRAQAEQEVLSILGEDHDKFMTTPWSKIKWSEKEDLPPIPDWLIPDFKKALLSVLPGTVEIPAEVTIRIAGSAPETILFGDVGLAINAFTKALPNSIVGDNFNMYIEKRTALDQLTMVLNERYKKKDLELMERRKTLMALHHPGTFKKQDGGNIITAD